MSIEEKAQEHEAQVWMLNNSRPAFVIYQPGEAGYGQEFCRDCGADMHPVRRSHGFTTCTPCASARETRR